MDKDLNIHAKITDAELAKQQLEQLGKATEDVGQRARQAEKTSGQSTDETNQKLEKKKGILDGLKNQVTSLIGGYFGFQAVITLISGFIAKLERVQQLQREIYERSLQMGDVGQRLEIQTGTTGKQNFWAKQALELQKAGGLRDINAAAEMMVSGDIAFSGIGGIKDKNVRQLLTQIAPVVGAAGLGGQEVAKAFEFAGAAGIAPNAGAYKKYFAQLRAGFTASKATDFGQFMVGLQQGATGYMAQGGSLEQAISLFTGARSVSANEALSATLIEQSTRLASGAYEKPRAAMEKALGVDWSKLSMDQQMQGLLFYVSSLPASSRIQTLTEAGFPAELTTQLSKLVSPEAVTSRSAALQKVSSTKPADLEKFTAAYQRSESARQRVTEATKAAGDLSGGELYGSWQRRRELANAEFDRSLASGEESLFIPDAVESRIIALESILADLQAMNTPESQNLAKGVQSILSTARAFPLVTYAEQKLGGLLDKAGIEYSRAAQSLQNVTINDHSTHYYPQVGDSNSGPRFKQD